MNNPPAFPLHTTYSTEHGMTLRDYFAAKALNGIIKRASFERNIASPDNSSLIAGVCYDIADAMLAEREKTK